MPELIRDMTLAQRSETIKGALLAVLDEIPEDGVPILLVGCEGTTTLSVVSQLPTVDVIVYLRQTADDLERQLLTAN